MHLAAPRRVAPRVLAYMIDFAVRCGIYSPPPDRPALRRHGQAMLLVGYSCSNGSTPWCSAHTRRCTPGKRVFGLQVVMDSGLPVTPAAALTRNLLRAADFLPLLYGFGLISMLLRRDFKRLGDLAAGTLVVYRDTVALHGELPPAPAAAPLRALAAREQAAIVAWAGRASRLTPARLDELAVLAQSVRANGGDATPPPARGAQWLVGRRGGRP